MKRKMMLVMGLAFGLFVNQVGAADDALSVASTVPMGERVAQLLQSYFNAVSAVVNIQHKKKVFEQPTEPFRAIVVYNSTNKVISVVLVGVMDNVEAVKPRLQAARQVILGLAKNVNEVYGVTLTDNDLEMAYYNASLGKKILMFKDGNYILPQ